MIPRRAPRTLTRRPKPKPWRPFLDALEAYGVTDYVPETATLTHGHDGIVIDVMVTDEDGKLLLDEDERGIGYDPVTRRRFYPHPERNAR